MKKAAQETTVIKGNDANGDSLSASAVAIFDKAPFVASLILVLIAFTPVLFIVFNYLGKLSDNKVAKHKALLSYRIKIAEMNKSKVSRAKARGN